MHPSVVMLMVLLGCAGSIRPRLLLQELSVGGQLHWPSGPTGQPTYPYTPGPAPHGKEGLLLPITSGMIVNLQSHVLQTFCNVAGKHARVPYALQCTEDNPSLVESALLVIGHDYTTNKQLFDGSKIMLKSQRNNKICSYGEEDQRFRITCADPDSTDASLFIIKQAKAREDLFYLEPANLPKGHKCYPANSAHTHGVGPEEPVPTIDGLGESHVMVCDGDQRGDNTLLHITPADYYGPNYPGGYIPPYPGGGGGQEPSESPDDSPDSGWPGGYPIPPYAGGQDASPSSVASEGLWSWMMRMTGLTQNTKATSQSQRVSDDKNIQHMDAVSHKHKSHKHKKKSPPGAYPPYPTYPYPPYPGGGPPYAPAAMRENLWTWVLRMVGMTSPSTPSKPTSI